MKSTSAAFVAASFALLALAQTSDSAPDALLTAEESYISGVCAPVNATGQPDLNAPCNQALAIELECVYGPVLGLEVFFSQYVTTTSPSGFQSTGDSDLPTDLMQSNATQRDCMCSSQFWSALNACSTCRTAHGDVLDAGLDASQDVPADLLASLSSTYCAASSTPTLYLGDFFYSWGTAHQPSTLQTSIPATFSDPLGVNKTAVSLYYTPSVTGTPAYVVAASTGSVSVSDTETITLVTFPSLKTSNGQIVATAVANNAAASGSGSSTGTGKQTGAQASSTGSPSGSSKPTTGGAPAPTQALAAAGLVGLAGLVALL